MGAVEFRGCKNLVFAEVTVDSKTGEYATGIVRPLAPVAEIAKTVETASEARYYDNKAAIVIDSEGSDTVTFTIAIPDDETLALITGRTYDATAKRFIESERVERYFAVGYILGEKGDGDDERFVWRFKGTFNIPDETSATENNGTDANNLSLVYTGIYTNHEFTNGKGVGVKGSAKAMFIRESANVCTADQFFGSVSTPDTTFADNTLTINAGFNTAITVTRNGVALTNGAAIASGDILTISATADAGYVLSSLTVNGETFVSGNTFTVSGDVVVVSTATASTGYDLSRTATNCTVIVTRDGGDVPEVLQDGEGVLQEGWILSFDVQTEEGYALNIFTINGDQVEPTDIYTVGGDMVIYAEADQI